MHRFNNDDPNQGRHERVEVPLDAKSKRLRHFPKIETSPNLSNYVWDGNSNNPSCKVSRNLDNCSELKQFPQQSSTCKVLNNSAMFFSPEFHHLFCFFRKDMQVPTTLRVPQILNLSANMSEMEIVYTFLRKQRKVNSVNAKLNIT